LHLVAQIVDFLDPAPRGFELPRSGDCIQQRVWQALRESVETARRVSSSPTRCGCAHAMRNAPGSTFESSMVEEITYRCAGFGTETKVKIAKHARFSVD
jgi:hypothetical protein